MNVYEFSIPAERAIERFEREWRRAPPQEIARYLPPELDEQERRALLAELFFIDMERNAAIGALQPVEAYLQPFPELREAPEIAAQLTAQAKRFRKTSSQPPSEGSPAVGQFGPFRNLRFLGQGGMSVVYQAEDVRLQRRVALKILPDDLVDDHKFRQEGEAAARLRHPNIVRVFETGVCDGKRYLAMELVDGESLQQQVARRGALTPEVAVRYIHAVAEAVQYAHSKHVLHRDLTPGNILIDNEDQPQIIDFGLAKLTDKTAPQTKTGVVMGARGFMPPEQQHNARSADQRSDV